TDRRETEKESTDREENFSLVDLKHTYVHTRFVVESRVPSLFARKEEEDFSRFRVALLPLCVCSSRVLLVEEGTRESHGEGEEGGTLMPLPSHE
uniref:Uncharacterized protein n=1 Tax=Aegilops tauschii subsp. strangulata TaxID=200361 RepID=A0A453DM74_AEGTS